jgi:hypothetical protein
MGKRSQAAEADDEQEAGPDTEDVLPGGWKIGLYGAALIPYGSWFVVIGSSVLYYAWRKESPNKAKAINRHGWLAWLFGSLLWGAIWFLGRETPAAVQAVPFVPQPVAAEPPVDAMGSIYQKVARDAVDRYELARKHGSAMQRCVQAQMVVAAFLQAKDEAQYAAWTVTQKADCAKAGLPQQP